MASEKKPATTRKPAKRGPTKQAALKALGITQDDLNAIKELRAQQKHYEALVEQVEPTPAANIEESVEDAEREPIWYARNLRNMEFRMRLNRQKEKTAPKPLKPRGQRGDLMRLEPDDLRDEYLLSNIEYGCIEVITEAEAQKVLAGQITNAQTAIHPAMAMLRNELGQEYAEGAVQGADQYVDESVVVAELNPVGGEFGEIQFSRQQRGSFDRVTQAPGQAAEQGRSLGGNPHLLSDGFAAARAQDKIARSKNIEGPAAGGVNRVVIDTPKKVVAPPKPKGS